MRLEFLALSQILHHLGANRIFIHTSLHQGHQRPQGGDAELRLRREGTPEERQGRGARVAADYLSAARGFVAY